MFYYSGLQHKKSTHKKVSAEKMCKTKQNEYDGEKDKNYNRIQTVRRRWRWGQNSGDADGVVWGGDRDDGSGDGYKIFYRVVTLL